MNRCPVCNETCYSALSCWDCSLYDPTSNARQLACLKSYDAQNLSENFTATGLLEWLAIARIEQDADAIALIHAAMDCHIDAKLKATATSV